jgi:hypothetical protein
MSVAKRNNQIKKVLEAKYGKGKVWVRGSRGTAYGWVSVYIDDDAGIRSEAMKLIDESKIEIDTYGYDDPGSDYGYGRKINISFYKPWDVRKKEEQNVSRI